MYANTLRPEFGSHVSNCAFERRLGYSHDVVVLDDHLAAVIGHRKKSAAAAHQRLGQASHEKKRPAGHFHGGEEAFPLYIDDTALQRLLRGESNRMDRKIEPAPFSSDTF